MAVIISRIRKLIPCILMLLMTVLYLSDSTAQAQILRHPGKDSTNVTGYRLRHGIDTENPFHTPDMIFGARAGLNNFFGLGHSKDTLLYFLPTYGVYVDFRAATKLVFESGLGFSYQGPKSMRLSSVTEYDTLGNHYTEVGIANILRLIYLEVPLLLNYSVSDRVHIYSGARLAWFITAEQRQSTSLYINDVFVRSETVKPSSSLTDHFTWMDVQIPLGAKYKLSPKFSIETSVYLGLVDISRDIRTNPVFDPVRRDTNYGYQIALEYRLL